RDADALARVEARAAVATRQADCSKPDSITSAIQEARLVVNALPGFLGFQALRTILEAGKDVVDISFFPEDALALHGLARERGVVALTDCGVAPGMSNFLLGYWDAHLEVQRFECLVGGLPQHPKPPFHYKAPFSPIDVIEEYTRPARIQRQGQAIVLPALSEVEAVAIPPVGDLEAFNSDGLRSLLHTLPHIPDMVEKTLRYPGHAHLISQFEAAGFFQEAPIVVDGQPVSPLALSSQLLTDQWKLEAGEPELTVMRIRIAGNDAGKPRTIQYDLYDTYDPATDTSSMARTTGYTCTAMVDLLLKGLYTTPGIAPPEHIGRDQQCHDAVLAYLKQRGVHYRLTEI
ncbi:MAG: saccharopine dehydrogenase C-terminal domain-containing protein, partial [Bacteroidota bacterium]